MSPNAPDDFDQTLQNPGPRRPGPDHTESPDAGATIPNERPVIDGRYRVIRKIGSGGMGDVYLAEDKDLIDNVAVKLLPSVIGTRKREVERLRQEAKLCRNLTHTNIVSTFTFGLDESRNSSPYLVMQYIDGETLDDVLADFPNGIPLERCARWIEEIASALDYAHESAILHRDIKPSNIMIDKTGRAYLMDFGIARQAQDTMLEVTGRDSSGTPKYMSPQQLAGKNSTSNDIYSFTATVYEMLSGAAPFHSGDITYQIREVPPKPVPHLAAHVNDALLAGLSKDPIQRPPSASDLARRIVEAPEEAPVARSAASSDAVVPIPRPFGGRRTTRSASSSGVSRSRTSVTTGSSAAAPTMVAAEAAPLAPAVAAGAFWAVLAAVGVGGILVGTASSLRQPPALGDWAARPPVLGAVGLGFVLAVVAALVSTRLLDRPSLVRAGALVAALLTLAGVLAVSFGRTSSEPLDAIVVGVLLVLAMTAVSLASAGVSDIWLRTGPALLAGGVLASVALVTGLATASAGALESALAPAVAVFVFGAIGGAAAAGRATVQAGLLAGLPVGLFAGLLAVAAVLAAQPQPDFAGALPGGAAGLALAPLGGLVSGFIARWWNPVAA